MKLLVATKNEGKFREIGEVLGALPVELVSLKMAGIDDDVEETAATHEENALLKARYFYEKTGLPTLGEDSGIYVDVFPGQLGVYTRRWEGLAQASDEEWIRYFLEKMEEVPGDRRGARFVCHAALILPDGSQHHFSGETRGVITHQLEAPLIPGIPLSSCFKHEGAEAVYAALTPTEKNQASHRGKAMRALAEFLAERI
ncbi:non-canonical purine NTP pyrophosphatase [Candidatus Peregrinibacteria bacterium CG_4_9_14_0_2_um_filter_53_11]|nr:MAG: non-canonical purine NTP pyrophosphatase [Candidatus Peregrinibacteria bacterium CG_4_9_14_0_2_um_filter_53_11]